MANQGIIPVPVAGLSLRAICILSRKEQHVFVCQIVCLRVCPVVGNNHLGVHSRDNRLCEESGSQELALIGFQHVQEAHHVPPGKTFEEG